MANLGDIPANAAVRTTAECDEQYQAASEKGQPDGYAALDAEGKVPASQIPAGGGSYTDEQAQDAVGLILADDGDIDFAYDDATPKITAVVKDGAVTFAKMQDIATARLLGRTGAGAGEPEEIQVGAGLALSAGSLACTITQYTNELAQDAVFGAIADSETIDVTYDDAGNSFSLAVRTQMSLDADASGLKLDGDAAAPGNSKYYGTDAGGAKGFHDLPAGGGGALSFEEADRATDLALTNSFQAAVSLALGAGTWLVLGQSSIESTSTTQSNVNIRLRDQTNNVTHSIAEGEVDSALPDRCNLAVHAVIVLAGAATIALEGRQSAGTSHMIGPGNLGDTAAKVTRISAIKIG